MTKHYIDAYVVPHHDENFSEYVPPNKERLRWASGFSGSLRYIIDNKNELYSLVYRWSIYTSGKNQTKGLNCKIVNISDCTFLSFLENNSSKFTSIGIDSKTISLFEYNNLCKLISKNQID